MDDDAAELVELIAIYDDPDTLIDALIHERRENKRLKKRIAELEGNRTNRLRIHQWFTGGQS